MQQTSTTEAIPPEIQLQGMGNAYRAASIDAHFYARQGNNRMAQAAAATRDRIYFEQVKPLLDQLVIQ